MKKLIIIILVIVSNNVNGQMAVTDPTSYAYLAQTVNNTLESLKISSESLETAKKTINKLEEINSKISQGKLVLAIGENMVSMTNNIKEYPSYIKKIKNKEVAKVSQEVVLKKMEKITLLNALFANATQTKVLSGGDFERLQFLMDIYDRTNSLNSELNNVKNILIRASR